MTGLYIKLTMRSGNHYWTFQIMQSGDEFILYNRRGFETGRVKIDQVVKIELSD